MLVECARESSNCNPHYIYLFSPLETTLLVTEFDANVLPHSRAETLLPLRLASCLGNFEKSVFFFSHVVCVCVCRGVAWEVECIAVGNWFTCSP